MESEFIDVQPHLHLAVATLEDLDYDDEWVGGRTRHSTAIRCRIHMAEQEATCPAARVDASGFADVYAGFTFPYDPESKPTVEVFPLDDEAGPRQYCRLNLKHPREPYEKFSHSSDSSPQARACAHVEGWHRER